MNIVFLFGGQGSQLPGMALDIRAKFPQTEKLFQMAFDQNPLLERILTNESSKIDQTKYTQPAIALFGAAVTMVLRENNFKANAAIGSSIGEYPALAAIDVWSPEDMIKIANERGRLMSERLEQRRVESYSDGMQAVLGLDEEAISSLIKKHKQVWITNINDAKQVVIGGQLEQLNQLEADLKTAGARRIVPLAVEGAFHTPIFQTKQAELLDIIKKYPLNISRKKFYFNRNGKTLSESGLSEKEKKEKMQLWMSEQMCKPVRFFECGEQLFNDSYDLVIEISAKPVLAGMLRKKIRNIETIQINNAEQLEDCLVKLNSKS